MQSAPLAAMPTEATPIDPDGEPIEGALGHLGPSLVFSAERADGDERHLRQLG